MIERGSGAEQIGAILARTTNENVLRLCQRLRMSKGDPVLCGGKGDRGEISCGAFAAEQYVFGDVGLCEYHGMLAYQRWAVKKYGEAEGRRMAAERLADREHTWVSLKAARVFPGKNDEPVIDEAQVVEDDKIPF